ncbi:MAG TPA: HEAT repeat domain-containing protein [Pirellulales bacterium]|nr:HEAT repeat domain-containing protein [Pirellulales bacterium]
MAPKNEGLSTTFDLLARSENEAATGTLLAALDSSEIVIRDAALRALLKRHSLAGHQELLRRLHQLDPKWREILHEYRGTMSHALRDALLSGDRQSCANACQAILWFHEYDLMPALINLLENDGSPAAALAAETALALADLFYDDLAGTRNFKPRQDPRTLRGHLVATLEASVMRYARHRRTEPIEAFVMLAQRDNVTLKQLLFDPLHASYRPLIDSMTHSGRPGVLRLLLGHLEDPQAPSATLTAIAHRRDAAFVKVLLRKIGSEPSAAAKRNLSRIEHFAWLQPGETLLDTLDDDAQQSAVQMVMASGMNRLEAFETIAHLVTNGTPGGRRAAARALAEFHGNEANQVALKALADDDPEVQAAILDQLRERGIPGAVSILLGLTDSPQPGVREAARRSLSEFNFARYLAAFDMLEDQVRRSTGALVRKVDPDAAPQLLEEMVAPSRRRRIRALQVAEAMQIVEEVEPTVVTLLADEDHLVRLEAARALAQSVSLSACLALREAEHDTSVTVREAAAESLDKLSRHRPDLMAMVDAQVEAALSQAAHHNMGR